MTRGEIYGEFSLRVRITKILSAEAQGFFLGLSLYFTINLDSSHKTDVFTFKNYNSYIVLPGRAILEVLILCIALAAGAIFSPIRSALLGAYWLVYSQLYLEYKGNYIILNNEILNQTL